MHTDRIAVVANIIKQHPNLLDQSRQSFFPDVRRGHPERESDAGDIASLTVALFAPQSTDEIQSSAEDILGLEHLFDIPLLSPTWPVDWAETVGIDMAPWQLTKIVHVEAAQRGFTPSAEQAFEILRWVAQHGKSPSQARWDAAAEARAEAEAELARAKEAARTERKRTQEKERQAERKRLERRLQADEQQRRLMIATVVAAAGSLVVWLMTR